MRIHKVIVEGFKRFQHREEFDLGYQTCLYGENDQGKTTIAEAIPYCFWGVDLAGNKDYDSLMNKEMLANQVGMPENVRESYERWLEHHDKEDSPEAQEEFFDEYEISIDPPRIYVALVVSAWSGPGLDFHVIERTRTRTSTRIKIDGEDSSQRSLDALLPDKELFLSIFCPGYFNGALDMKKRRGMVARFCEDLDIPGSLEESIKKAGVKIGEEERRYLHDPLNPQVRKQVTSQKNELRASLSNSRASLETMDQVGPEDLGDHTKVDQEIYLQYAAAVENLKRWENYAEKIRAAKEWVLEHERRAERLESILDWMRKNDPQEPDRTSLEKLITEKGELLDRTRDEPMMIDPDLTECPSCGLNLQQHFDKQNAAALKQWREEQEPIQAAILDIDRKISEESRKLEEATRIWTLAQRYQGEREQLEQLMQEAGVWPANGLSDEELEKNLKEANQQVAETGSAYNDEVQRVAAHNAKVDQASESRRKASELRGSLQEIVDTAPARIKTLERVEAVLKIFPSVVVTKQTEAVSKHLDKCSIKLVDIQKNGNLKDVFDVHYAGVPYHRLSNSARIKADIEIARVLNIMSGIEDPIPIFIDNAESVTEMPGMLWDQQHILAYVHQGQEPVLVRTAEKS